MFGLTLQLGDVYSKSEFKEKSRLSYHSFDLPGRGLQLVVGLSSTSPTGFGCGQAASCGPRVMD